VPRASTPRWACSKRGPRRRCPCARHYRDKDELLAALATRGYQDLRKLMSDADASAPAGEELVAVGRSYVRYALEHPGLFRLMFGHPCSRSHPDTTAAAAEVTAVLAARVSKLVPEERRPAFMVGLWSLVHGLASLVLDGKLTPGGPEQVDELVGDTVRTMLEPNPTILSS
jgi:AcrR family transcriptional regulator